MQTPSENCKALDREAAMELLGIDRQSLETLIVLFSKELGEWTDFFTTVVGGDTNTIKSKAHRLKSDAANVGAMRVSRAAAALEAACVRDADAVEPCRAALVSALWELHEELV
ncbi:Hpt domain-containing protein [Desulfovibrio psychrotolerans]|uniref:HPt domain-containing protein n=1 Tax=Desulfovibrio psychrotolerans TaxID=415242 RepID=A0A7J0BPV4_9BACT|nr:Hpt domain-containing protein [Desulfovibrio psychrotolerans]GFM35737.1 hypothetical protein DSM19430T_04210 [Desulfovibrio psychrotolerans]